MWVIFKSIYEKRAKSQCFHYPLDRISNGSQDVLNSLASCQYKLCGRNQLYHKRSRLPVSAEACMQNAPGSQRGILSGHRACRNKRRFGLCYNSSSYIAIATAAIPAVSVRKIVFPRVTLLAPILMSASASLSENPPSGPMMTAAFLGFFSMVLKYSLMVSFLRLS
jgi:hypothetical protein